MDDLKIRCTMNGMVNKEMFSKIILDAIGCLVKAYEKNRKDIYMKGEQIK